VRVKIDIVFVPHTPCPVPDIVPLLLQSSTILSKDCTPYSHHPTQQERERKNMREERAREIEREISLLRKRDLPSGK